MHGEIHILHFAVPICEIAYILERPDGVCNIQLKNGATIVAQESFKIVTEAYEEVAGRHFEFQEGGLVDAPLRVRKD